ncbi:TetR/AcrR family transcriptional regulator [Gemella sanguinis]|uniref:TetR/AcrR family transcriptional regulator n=1 Tax=Gemella sanguinis TaxID=84135 RepID=UPI00352D4CB4
MKENILSSYLDIMKEEKMPPGKKKTIEAAIKLFAKQGYNGTSTLQIAKVAGVSQATVFKYFKTKEDLLYSITLPVLPKLYLVFLGRVQNANSIQELIRYIVRDRFEFLEENSNTVKILYSEILTNENLKKQVIESTLEIFDEFDIKKILHNYKKINPEINENLTTAEIIRSFAGPIITYVAQRFVLFENVPCETQEHDLQFIENQIYRNITK